MPDATLTGNVQPLPATNILDAVRESCLQAMQQQIATQSLQLDETIMNSWLTATINASNFDVQLTAARHAVQPAGLPLRFECVQDELTVYALLALLEDSLLADEAIIQAASDRSSQETILFGVISLHIGDQALDTQRLAHLTLSEVSSFFMLPLQHEVPHPTLPCVTMGERAPTYPVAERVRTLLNTVGQQLQAGEFASLGAAVYAAAEQASIGADGASSVEAFMHQLLINVPAFNDGIVCHSQTVYTLSALQRLCERMQLQFTDASEHAGCLVLAPTQLTARHPIRLARVMQRLEWLPSTLALSEAAPISLAIVERLREQSAYSASNIEALLLAA